VGGGKWENPELPFSHHLPPTTHNLDGWWEVGSGRWENPELRLTHHLPPTAHHLDHARQRAVYCHPRKTSRPDHTCLHCRRQADSGLNLFGLQPDQCNL
jgi:hypothetical protein